MGTVRRITVNVLVFGAAGGIGKWVVEHARSKGYEVTAYVRNAAKLAGRSDVRVIEGGITDSAKIRNALEGQDAVIWCVGIPMKRRLPNQDSLDGHRVLLETMNEAGVKRLVDWGTPSVHFSADKRSFVTVVPGMLAGIVLTDAKAEMVAIGEMLEKSSLDWTMVRFMMPRDTPYTGRVKVGFGDVKMNLAISREDIAAFMVDQVEDRTFVRSMPIIGS